MQFSSKKKEVIYTGTAARSYEELIDAETYTRFCGYDVSTVMLMQMNGISSGYVKHGDKITSFFPKGFFFF